VMAHLGEMRRHIQSLCETKCLHRGVRQMLSLKQAYSAAELASKPFVVPKLVQDLDPNDPDQKAALIAQATGAQGAIFGTKPGDQVAAITDGTGAPEPGTTVIDSETGEVVEPMQADDFGDVPEVQEPVPCVCACTCGHQAEVSQQVHDVTKEKIGTPRCKLCFPGKSFDFKLHEDVPNGLLGFTDSNGKAMTVDAVRAFHKQQGWMK